MKTFDLDADKPALIPEIIAELVTHSPKLQAWLCERARHHWQTSPGFRQSFRRKDERDMLHAWMNHWHAAAMKRDYSTANRNQTP